MAAVITPRGRVQTFRDKVLVGRVLRRFDFAVIRYSWDSSGGTDLDTHTGLIGVSATVDGIYVGWDGGIETVSGPSGPYLQWGGDNTGPVGAEAALIDFGNIANDYPALSVISARMLAHWYNSRISGALSLTFETWLGGSMQHEGEDFVNSGGNIVDSINLSRNAIHRNPGNAYSDLGTLTYRVATRTATIIDAG